MAIGKHLALTATALLGAGFATAAQTTTRVQRAIGGFIPGSYFNKCLDCKCQYLGDKHSVYCEACATKSHELAIYGNHYQQFDGLGEDGEPLFSHHIPSVDMRYLREHGKDLEEAGRIGYVAFQGEMLPFEREPAFTLSDIRRDDMRPILCVGGMGIGRMLNEHWPEPFSIKPDLDEMKEMIKAVAFTEKQSWSGTGSGSYSIYYGNEYEKPDRQRWKARDGMHENILSKRRKANKAAKKARKKSRK